ncbi:MAG: beta-galactosidase [Tepidisphaeraceae bacterium]
MVRHKSFAVALAVMSLNVACFAGGNDSPSFQFAAKGPAKIDQIENGVHLRIDNPNDWAGLQLLSGKGDAQLDLSAWKTLAMDIENVSPDKQMRLVLTIASGGSDRKTHHEVTSGLALNPGEKRTFRYDLPHQWKYAPPQSIPGPRTVDTAKIDSMILNVQWPFELRQAGLVDCRITNVRMEGPLKVDGPDVPADQYVPFIDVYGQNIHRDWPTKIHSDADLVTDRKQEAAELAKSTRPQTWDRYGGWKNGPTLKATGNFRTEKHDGKWYFVDPDGHLFFSQGMDVVHAITDSLKVMPGKESWFQSLPAGAKSYQPTDHCLTIKYGTPEYQDAFFATAQKRMDAWGFNTYGDWCRPEVMDLGQTPYTLQLTDYDNKSPKLAASKSKFYDVFDPAYVEKMKHLVENAAKKNPLVTKSLTDPMCIGYFIDNELNFGNRGRMVLVDEVLKCPAGQPSKQEFVRDLKQKYATIDKLNDAWQTKHADWDALLASTDVPTSDGYKADANVFFQKTLDQYFRLCRDAIKSVAPHRLYLGCRFISTDAVRPALYKAAQKYCDVLSTNIYSFSAANFPSSATPGSDFPDMPVLIGEFHFGSLSRGMFNGGLCTTNSEADRALAYTRFMEGVLAHPNFVGAHWFQFRDQPLTGRGDGEAYPIGFVDITDVPYKQLAHAAREIAEHMYAYRAAGNLAQPLDR